MDEASGLQEQGEVTAIQSIRIGKRNRRGAKRSSGNGIHTCTLVEERLRQTTKSIDSPASPVEAQ